jgi:hypothetical protein
VITSLEKIAASFLGNTAEHSAVGPESMPAFSEIAASRYEEVKYSVEEYVPSAFEVMVDEHPGREAQVTNITSRADLFAPHLGVSKELHDGDAEAMEKMLDGTGSAHELLSRDSTAATIITQNDRLYADMSQPEIVQSPQQNIAYLQQRAKEAAGSGRVDTDKFNNPDSVNQVAHAA